MENKMNIPFSPPDICEDEINEVREALLSGWITTGPKTKELERRISDYLGTNKTVCLNSATAAMELTLHLLGVGKGDEVIVPAYTYTATCSVVCHVGATPIMADVAKDSFEMDYNKLGELITEKTKVIIPVDIGGVVCDYEKLFEVVDNNKSKFKPSNSIQELFGRIIVMSDCAHGFGASRNGVMAGNIADFTSFSFHAVKNFTTAEGGAVTWKSLKGLDNEYVYKEFQNLSLHGQTKDALSKTKLGSWEYDIVYPGYKCNMTDIMGAIGLAQLKTYGDKLEKRRRIIEIYNSALSDSDVTFLKHYDGGSISSGHLYLVRINGISEVQRNEIIVKMAERGIACNVHYKPLPMLTAYKNLGFDIKNYPNSYNVYKNLITLPLYSKLREDEANYVIDNFVSILGEYK